MGIMRKDTERVYNDYKWWPDSLREAAESLVEIIVDSEGVNGEKSDCLAWLIDQPVGIKIYRLMDEVLADRARKAEVLLSMAREMDRQASK